MRVSKLIEQQCDAHHLYAHGLDGIVRSWTSYVTRRSTGVVSFLPVEKDAGDACLCSVSYSKEVVAPSGTGALLESVLTILDLSPFSNLDVL